MEDAKVLSPAWEAMRTAMRREAQAKAAGEVWIEAALRAAKAKVEAMNATLALNTATASEAFVKSAGVEATTLTATARVNEREKIEAYGTAQAAATAAQKAWTEALTTETT